jgi:hypothetical protein
MSNRNKRQPPATMIPILETEARSAAYHTYNGQPSLAPQPMPHSNQESTLTAAAAREPSRRQTINNQQRSSSRTSPIPAIARPHFPSRRRWGTVEGQVVGRETVRTARCGFQTIQSTRDDVDGSVRCRYTTYYYLSSTRPLLYLRPLVWRKCPRAIDCPRCDASAAYDHMANASISATRSTIYAWRNSIEKASYASLQWSAACGKRPH